MRTDPATARVTEMGTTTVAGTFYRHAAPNRDAFAGGTAGRWGADFPVIYLGRPPDSVTIEAYRHLVDPFDIPRAAVKARILYTVTVTVTDVLDLTDPANLAISALSAPDLTSEVDDYSACQQIADAAHRLGRHAILARPRPAPDRRSRCSPTRSAHRSAPRSSPSSYGHPCRRTRADFALSPPSSTSRSDCEPPGSL